MDHDDLVEVLIEIERSLEIELPHDLRHVFTVGDLNREVVARAGPAAGLSCPTTMVFYRLRRELAKGARDVRPAAELSSLGIGVPRVIRRRLARRTGWRMPGLTIGWVGCAALLAAPFAAAALWWLSYPWLIAVPIAAAVLAVRCLDPGVWHGSWTTLGALSRAVAALNHARLVESGARHSDETIRQAIATLLAEKGAEMRRPGVDTRLLA